MGWCPEFGARIHKECDHAMVAGRQACTCDACGVECRGRFNGCKDVWLAGPKHHPSFSGVRRAPSGVGAAAEPAATVPPPPVGTGTPVPTAPDVVTAVTTMGRQLKAVYELLKAAEVARGSSDENLEALRTTVDDLVLERVTVLELLAQQRHAVSDLPEIRAALDKLVQQQADLAALVEARSAIGRPRVGRRPDSPPPRSGLSLDAFVAERAAVRERLGESQGAGPGPGPGLGSTLGDVGGLGEIPGS